MDQVWSIAVDFLTGKTPYTGECQAFFMAIQGAVNVRSGVNRNRQLHWFHAFALSVMAGFAGGWLGFLLMAKPTSMFSNDLNMAACIVAFVLVNYTPFDVGYKVFGSVPGQAVTAMWAQLFRALGLMKFSDVCFEAFKDNPSAYYPIPVFGPIMYGTLLGNMGGFLMKGLEGHFANGMPWPVQNGTLRLRRVEFVDRAQNARQGSFAALFIISLFTTRRDPSDQSCAVRLRWERCLVSTIRRLRWWRFRRL